MPAYALRWVACEAYLRRDPPIYGFQNVQMLLFVSLLAPPVSGHPTAAVQVDKTIYRAVAFTCVAARDRFMAAAAGHPDVVSGRVSVALYCEESGADEGRPLYSLPSTSVQMIDNLPSTMSEGEFVKVMLVHDLTSLMLCGKLMHQG